MFAHTNEDNNRGCFGENVACCELYSTGQDDSPQVASSLFCSSSSIERPALRLLMESICYFAARFLRVSADPSLAEGARARSPRRRAWRRHQPRGKSHFDPAACPWQCSFFFLHGQRALLCFSTYGRSPGECCKAAPSFSLSGFTVVLSVLACCICSSAGSWPDKLRRRARVVVVNSRGALGYFSRYRGDRSRRVGSGQGSSHRLALQEPGEPSSNRGRVVLLGLSWHSPSRGSFAPGLSQFIAKVGTQRHTFERREQARVHPPCFLFLLIRFRDVLASTAVIPSSGIGSRAAGSVLRCSIMHKGCIWCTSILSNCWFYTVGVLHPYRCLCRL